MSETYLSIFSGIGGFECPGVAPLLYCEADPACQHILRLSHPDVPIVGDVRGLRTPPRAGMVVGGWPCQDISSAGTLGGIHADRSGLFFEMLKAAKAAEAHTVVGENVPNLLTINEGKDFWHVLRALEESGYPHIGWRILNAREFGLPQQRRRLFIVASTHRERAHAIHAAVPQSNSALRSADAFGFYWTGGKRSICFSRGFVPALKIGATDNKGRAPVAVLLDDQLRKLGPDECLRLQGFEDLNRKVPQLAASALLRMAGNAVPKPMGHFVLKAIADGLPSDGVRDRFGAISGSGLYEDGVAWSITHAKSVLAENLRDFLNDSGQPLSSQAAAGLLVRSIRAEQPMPFELFERLSQLAAIRNGTLWPSRGNSFEALDKLTDVVSSYRSTLKPISDYQSVDDDE